MGQWVSVQRSGKDELTPERITRLESLKGWVWDILEFQWEEGFSYLKAYVEKEGHARVIGSYKTEDGYKLGQWVNRQRLAKKKNKLTSEKIIRLESLNGWVWGAHDSRWEKWFSYLKEFVEREGHARVPFSYKTADEYYLGRWVDKQRLAKKKNKLTPERIKRLESLKGWVWDASTKGKGSTN